MEICNLYTLTEYSFLKSTIKINNLIEFKKQDNQSKYVSISDNNLSGYYKFNKMALEYNLKPLFGFNTKIDNYEFLIYIKNEKGYYNLLKLNNKLINRESLSLNDIKEYENDLIFILLTDNVEIFGLKTDYIYFKNLKNFYIQYNLNSEIENIFSLNEFNYIPLLKQTYLFEEEKDAYVSLRKIETDKLEKNYYKYFNNLEFLNYYNNKIIYKNLENLILSINFNLPNFKFNLPNFSTNSYQLLKELLIKSLKEKKLINNKIYIDRVKFELDIITKLNFIDYFLIVYDIINYAKNNNILVGPGRGSAVGSLISYLLSITEIDPLKYDLYFERFLNPERKTMPDIDIDFPDDKREEVIKYCIEKYGKDKVCLISTYDTFQIKSISRELIKQYNIKEYEKNQILEQISNEHPDLENEIVKDILSKTNYIKGLYRNRSTHASGVIISNKSLLDTIPLELANKDIYQSQYQMNEIEEMGLLKIDFLGLKNLAIINQVINLVKKNNQNFEIKNISLNDKKTFDLINSLETDAIFQLETKGIKSVIKKVGINNFEDLVSILALFRPGPMDNIDTFSYNKNNNIKNYLHKDLAPILEKTYGIIVYQEQIMEICEKIAGYSLAQADLFRRAISKKKEDILNLEKPKFINSCINNGYTEELATKLFNYIYKFANYGFNRSHSVAYALISYRMCYLKANYPIEFYTTILNNNLGNEENTKFYINKLIKNNAKIYPPLVNKSGLEYKVNKNNILLPLSIIKNISNTVIDKIIKEREKKEFESYIDFKNRCKEFLDENILKQLIYSNSFFQHEKNQNKLLQNTNIFKLNIDFNLFNLKEVVKEENIETTFEEKVLYEKKAFGFNIFYNIFSNLDYNKLEKSGYKKLNFLKQKDKILSLVEIIDIREINTKDRKKMAFILVSDGINELELTCFYEVYEEFIKKYKINDKKLYSILVKKSNFNNKINYILEQITKYN